MHKCEIPRSLNPLKSARLGSGGRVDCEIDVIKDRRNFWPFQYLYRVLNILEFQKMDDQNQLMSREQRGEGRISMKGRLERERKRERGASAPIEWGSHHHS